MGGSWHQVSQPSGAWGHRDHSAHFVWPKRGPGLAVIVDVLNPPKRDLLPDSAIWAFLFRTS